MPVYDKITLLLVESDEKLLAQLTELFSGLYHIKSAKDGFSALEKMRTESVSVVLADDDMDDMNGSAFLREVQMDPALSAIPVILMLEDNREEALVQAYTGGASGIQIKPIRPRALRAYVESKMRQFSHTLRHKMAHEAPNVPYEQTDSLTGLMQRSVFCEAADKRIKAKESNYYVIACLDVDQFKVLNDQYGLAVGDCILQKLAEVITQHILQCNGIASRLFADNFAIMVPQHHLAILRQTLNALEHAFEGDPYSIHIHVSCGCCIIDNPELPASTILDRAILAKSTIKGRYDTHIAYYNEAMRQSLLEEQWIIGEMERALEQKQFQLWLQPQYDIGNSTLIGAEALVRWIHPERGMISPGKFITLFERTGFIYRVDAFIWEEACRCLREWIDRGLEPLPISVNVSRYDLFRHGFLNTIISMVERYRIPKNLFRLEITESAFVKPSKQLITVVQKLQEYGILVEIDDFGSGYSSFNTLKDVPADILKIDMEFLSDSGDSQRGGNILESIIRMAKWLGMNVIAEGVEKKEQADYLRSIGCPYVQGYLYGYPMPITDYEKVLNCSEKRFDIEKLESTTGLHPDAFWDPASLETLVFNRYAGGACVFELCNNQLETLRVNEKFIAAFRLVMDESTILAKKELFPFPIADRNEVRRLLTSAIHSNSPEILEAECDLTPYGGHVEHIRFTVRMIAHVEDRYLFYQYVENITAQHTAEIEIKDVASQLQLLSNASSTLLHSLHSEKAIQQLLCELCSYFDADYSYIAELDETKKFITVNYGYGRFDKELSELGHTLPFDDSVYWVRALTQDGYLSISDVSTLDDAHEEARAAIEAKKLHSVAAVGLRQGEEMIGSVYIVNPRMNLSHLPHLSAIGDCVSIVLQRLHLHNQVKEENLRMQSVIDNMPGGFLQAKLSASPDQPPQLLYLSDGLCKMLNRSREELYSYTPQMLQSYVHPDDIPIHQVNFRRMQTEDSFSSHYRILRGDKQYASLTVYYTATHLPDGSRCINLYYYDDTLLPKD